MTVPDATRVQKYAEAIADLRGDGLCIPDRFDRAAARAVIALVDEEHARLSAESQQAIATAAEAVKRQRERAEAAEAKLAGMREETRTLADGMGGSVWSDGKLVQSITKPNTIQRRLVTEWTSE